MKQTSVKWLNRFRKANNITILFIYLVILAGGVVRCTGSGMGCPDWPKCFGLWIPPTHESQLPDNYVELYSKGGHLTVEFNVYKTWTEYINRLLGALAGVSVFVVLIISFFVRKINRFVLVGSFAAFLLMGFQGWLGAKVVATNLKPLMITIHMFFALIILSVLIWLRSISRVSDATSNFSFQKVTQAKIFSFFGMFLTLIQTLLGTQVRQKLEELPVEGLDKTDWVHSIGNIMPLHIASAYILILFTVYYIWKSWGIVQFKNMGIILILIIITEHISGVILYKFGLPAWVQPIHLLVATVIYGFYFYHFLYFSKTNHVAQASSN